MSGVLRGLLKDEAGASSVEYGFLVALLALVLVVSLQGLGLALEGNFGDSAEKLREVERCVEVGSTCDMGRH
jgi:Flp pilus assembly pilin Flp